jgi:esterase/lipase superfamily enzyme
MIDDNGLHIVTNRRVFPDRTGFDQFGKDPNPKGPLELRVAKVRKVGTTWKVAIQDDVVTRTIDGKTVKEPGSQAAARVLFQRLGRTRRNLVLFVHGFNNDMHAVVERAYGLRRLYGVEVVAFSWPANGGGLKGIASYKSDKRDAVASVGALDRTLEKMRTYVTAFRQQRFTRLRQEAAARSGSSREREDELMVRLAERDCPFRITLMLHSMGNYLLKHLMKSSIFSGNELIFDNVVLAAADANNKNHRAWVDRISARHRVYVTINEHDAVLRASRLKGGEEQLARLGHYPYNLESRQSVYVDFTQAAKVGDAHAYFEGGPVANHRVRRFFRRALRGQTAEQGLEYDAARNLYRVT